MTSSWSNGQQRIGAARNNEAEREAGANQTELLRQPSLPAVSAGFLVGVAAVVGTQKLSANERIRIATYNGLARNHIVRVHANARAESIIGVCLRIIGCLTGLMPLARIGRFDRDQSCQCREHADESNPAILFGCRFHLSHRLGICSRWPMPSTVQNLVAQLRERCDAGHTNDVMRITKKCAAG